MRYFLTLFLLVFGSTAQAHPGHIADLAGHDHWVAGAAIGLAILTGIYGALKGKKKTETEADEDQGVDGEGEPA